MTFFDIFSKKVKYVANSNIIVDNRENNSLVYLELKKMGLNVLFEQLEIADYLVNGVAIERKTISDFKSSIINKRIFSQIDNLKKYPKFILIIEGIQDEDIYSGIIHENSFRGMILSLVLNYEVPIIYTKNEKDTAKYISVIASRKEKRNNSIRISKSKFSDKERVQFILEGFSGIGPVAARKLVERFGNLKNIFNASLCELEKIIGKKAKEFYSIINII
jgi:ERCC4-type nuclease